MIKEIESKEELLSLLEKNNNRYTTVITESERSGGWTAEFIKEQELSHSLLYDFEHPDHWHKIFNIDGNIVFEIKKNFSYGRFLPELFNEFIQSGKPMMFFRDGQFVC